MTFPKMGAGKDFWNSEKTDQFIALWESKPCLYDSAREDYHDRNITKKAREEIATAFGISGELVLNIFDVKQLAYLCILIVLCSIIRVLNFVFRTGYC